MKRPLQAILHRRLLLHRTSLNLKIFAVLKQSSATDTGQNFLRSIASSVGGPAELARENFPTADTS